LSASEFDKKRGVAVLVSNVAFHVEFGSHPTPSVRVGGDIE